MRHADDWQIRCLIAALVAAFTAIKVAISLQISGLNLVPELSSVIGSKIDSVLFCAAPLMTVAILLLFRSGLVAILLSIPIVFVVPEVLTGIIILAGR